MTVFDLYEVNSVNVKSLLGSSLYLFTMQYGSFFEKHYILVTGVLMILGRIVLRDTKLGFRDMYRRSTVI